MSFWKWNDKPAKFDTFEEAPLKDGALKDAIIDMAEGDSPAAAIVKAVTTKENTMPQINTDTPAKSIFASKTFWFNLLTGAGTLIGTYGGMLPPSALPYVGIASALINIGLRFVTDQPVSVTGK